MTVPRLTQKINESKQVPSPLDVAPAGVERAEYVLWYLAVVTGFANVSCAWNRRGKRGLGVLPTALNDLANRAPQNVEPM